MRQYEGAVQADQGGDRQREAAAHATRGSPRRSAAASACARSIRATSCARRDANGIVVITQLQPIGVVFPIPEDSAAARAEAAARRRPHPGRGLRPRRRRTSSRSGRLLTVDNQIDTATGTVKLKAEFPNADGALFPNQFVNVRMPRRDAGRRDARADGGDPARRRRERSSTSSRTTRRSP